MFNNPEFIRNVRLNLGPGKLFSTAGIAIILTFVIGFSLNHIQGPSADGPGGWGFYLLKILFWLQALILAAGGGIACANAIYREKDQNTFDFQRVTRLSPLELTLGKLFGAPVFMYFLCLCFTPMVVFAAWKGQRGITYWLPGCPRFCALGLTCRPPWIAHNRDYPGAFGPVDILEYFDCY
jgi:hypothetical protein